MGIVIVQPTVPSYRVDFFDRLHQRYGDDLVVYSSALPMGAISGTEFRRPWLHRLGQFRTILPGLDWQQGAASIPISRNDILIVPGAPRNLSNLVLLVRARLIGAKTIWWGHYWSSTTRLWRFYIRVILMKLADAILFYTDREVSEYNQTNKIKPRRLIRSISNGINVDPIKNLRQPYAAEGRPNRIIFIGRLTRKARLPLLLEALSLKAANSVHLDVIGDGDDRQALEQYAAKIGVADRVQWHGGTTDETEIARIANRARAFVYPGDVGLSVVHAMAYGLPIILHGERRAHMPEFAAFSDQETGWSFSRGNAEVLAKVIGASLANDERLNAASRHAAATIDTSFNTEVMAERFIRLVSELAARH